MLKGEANLQNHFEFLLNISQKGARTLIPTTCNISHFKSFGIYYATNIGMIISHVRLKHFGLNRKIIFLHVFKIKSWIIESSH